MKGKKILLIVLIAVLVSAAAVGAGLGIYKSRTQSEKRPAGEVATATDVTSLRELLLEDSKLTITVDEEIEVEEEFVVKGDKTLTGKGEIRMKLCAELGQALLAVADGASLTVDGLVLNGNFVADGIHMESGAIALTYLSGTIKRTDAYAIQAQGQVTVKDINIEWADYIGIYAKKGSQVVINGGSLYKTATDDLYIDKGATLKIDGNPKFEGCMGDSVLNYGSMNAVGGTFKECNSYTFNNYGTMSLKKVDCSGSRLGVLCTRKAAETTVTGCKFHDTNRQGVVTVGGKTTILDSSFENTGYHSIEIQTGEATVENVTVKNSKNAGMELYTDADVKVKNLTITGYTGIGIAARGGKLEGSNIRISDGKKYGISCGNSKNGKASVKVSDVVIQNTEKSAFYVYNKATMDLTDVEAVGSGSRGIYIEDTASLTLSGNSLIHGNKYRGIEARGKFVMNSGKVYDNKVVNSGAGVYVSEKGNFTMNGGSIYNNDSGLRGGGVCVTEGKVTINKGDIYNNTAKDNGGGIYSQKTAVVTLKSGLVKDNKSEIYGDGIYIASAATKVLLGEDFRVSGNDIKLGNVESVLQITGSKLAKNSASDPLLLTPSYSAKEKTVLATCKSDSVAKSMAIMVKSGDGSYNVIRNAKNFVVEYATADMSMEGADTVRVSNFAELKKAVLGTKAKRNIILTGDIAVTERLRLPGGVTIAIKDDGTSRKITRADGFVDNLFVTHYGTGLILEASAPGKLTVDGTFAKVEDGKKVQPLVRTAGSTIMRNVTLQNNGYAVKGSTVRGALFRQLYGDFEIYDSNFTGGRCESGGAIMLDKGKGTIVGSTFADNESVIGAGAIRAAAGTSLDIKDSEFKDNNAGTAGGAIVAVKEAKVTATGTTFVNNTAKGSGGAIYLDNASLTASSCTFGGKDKGNVSGDKGGAIFVTGKGTVKLDLDGDKNLGSLSYNQATVGGAIAVYGGQATVSGYTLSENEAKDGGGAIYIEGSKTDGSQVATENCSFEKNSTAANGGAVHCKDTYTDKNSTYVGNQARNGGAVIAINGGKLDMSATTGQMKENTVTANGSAIFIQADGSEGKVAGYTFLGTPKQTLQTNGTLVFNDLPGATLVQGSKGVLKVVGAKNMDQVTLTPAAYTADRVLIQKGEGISDADFATACKKIQIAPQGGKDWFIDEDGKLSTTYAAHIGATKYDTLEAAIAAANTSGGVICLMEDVAISKQITITNHVIICNEPGKDITISRTKDVLMFKVNEGATLMLGTNGEESGKLTVNGATSAVAGQRVVDNYGTFTLGKNASLTGAKSSVWGNVLINRAGQSHLYGTIENNTSTGACGPILQNTAGGKVTIYEGTYSGNSATRSVASTQGGSVGGFMYVNAGSVEIQGGTFEKNTSTGLGGAIYIKTGASVTIKGGTFKDNTVAGAANDIHTEGSLSLDTVKGLAVSQAGAGVITICGEAKVSDLAVSLKTYTEGAQVMTGDASVAKETFAAICDNTVLAPDASGTNWKLDEDGKLLTYLLRMGDTTYTDWTTAIAAATGKADAVLCLLNDVEQSKAVTVSKNLTIVNESGVDAKIQCTANIVMFTVNAGVKFTLGTNAEGETGSLTLDGNIGKAATARMLNNKGTFVVGKNVILQNANNNQWGSVLVNSGTADIYGSFQNNTCTGAGGAILQNGGTLTIYDGIHTGNKGTRSAANSSGPSLGGFLRVEKGTAVIKGGVFEKNITTGNGGAIWTQSGTTLNVTGGSFKDNKADAYGNGIYITGSADIKGATFAGEVPQEIYVKGTITHSGIPTELVKNAE